jgi:hypothetical protein
MAPCQQREEEFLAMVIDEKNRTTYIEREKLELLFRRREVLGDVLIQSD